MGGVVPVLAMDITGDSMVLKERGKMVVFEGNVRIEDEGNVLRADRVVHYKDQGLAEAFGHVQVEAWGKKGERFQGEGRYGRYDQNAQHAELRRNAWMKKMAGPGEEPLEVYGDRIVFLDPQRQLVAKGHVRLMQGTSTWATAEGAVYDQAIKVVTLWGGPPVLFRKTDKGTTRIQGRRVTIHVETKMAEVEKSVTAHMVPGS